MKTKITERELTKIVEGAVRRAYNDELKEGKDMRFVDKYVKANRKGSRDSEFETKGDGFKSNTKVFKSQKDYSRKGKNKPKWEDDLEEVVNKLVDEALRK